MRWYSNGELNISSVTLLIRSEAAESGQSGEFDITGSLVWLVGVCSCTCVTITTGSATAEIGEVLFSAGSALAESGERLPPLFSGRLVGAGPERSITGTLGRCDCR